MYLTRVEKSDTALTDGKNTAVMAREKSTRTLLPLLFASLPEPNIPTARRVIKVWPLQPRLPRKLSTYTPNTPRAISCFISWKMSELGKPKARFGRSQCGLLPRTNAWLPLLDRAFKVYDAPLKLNKAGRSFMICFHPTSEGELRCP